jgi:hypothetical protein
VEASLAQEEVRVWAEVYGPRAATYRANAQQLGLHSSTVISMALPASQRLTTAPVPSQPLLTMVALGGASAPRSRL